MSRIILELRDGAAPTDASADQHWLVSRLRAYELAVSNHGQRLPLTPGLLVITPLRAFDTFLTVGESLQLMPDTALVLDGASCDRLRFPPDFAEDSDGITIGVVEIDATLDGERRLRELLTLPAILSSRDNDAFLRLYANLTLVAEGEYLLAGEHDKDLHLMAGQLIYSLIRSNSTSMVTPTKGSSPADDLKRFLRTDLDKKLTMDMLLDHFKMSSSSFKRWSLKVLGTTASRYRRTLQLEYSQNLLREDLLNIDQIAETTGFADRYHFSKAFKQEFGVSPAQFRRTPSEPAIPQTPYVLYEQNQFGRALELCEKALKGDVDGDERDRLLHLRVKCLEAMGRVPEALEAWEDLQDSTTIHLAGMQLARSWFSKEFYDLSLDQIEKALESQRESDFELAVQVWMDQVMSLVRKRRGLPLRRYLELRRSRFVDDVKSASLAGYALFMLGDFDATMEHCAVDKSHLPRIYYQRGEFDKALEAADPEARERLLIKMLQSRAQYQTILDTHPPDSGKYVAAFMALNGPQETIRRFPRRSMQAHLHQGDFETVLEVAAPGSVDRIYALYGLGRRDELETFGTRGSYEWHVAQLYGNPANLLAVDFVETPGFIHHARLLVLWNALKNLHTERASQLVAECQDVQDDDFFWHDHKYEEVLLSATTRAILGDRDVASRTWKTILERFRYVQQQVPWYAAGYLMGTVTDDEFLNQPVQTDVGGRLLLLQGIKADLEGDSGGAKQHYEELRMEVFPHNYGALLTVNFLEWRCSG